MNMNKQLDMFGTEVLNFLIAKLNDLVLETSLHGKFYLEERYKCNLLTFRLRRHSKQPEIKDAYVFYANYSPEHELIDLIRGYIQGCEDQNNIVS